jgi:hypothetical protein
MKKILSVFMLFLFLISCQSDDENTIDPVGEWRLIEILMDPGDGSGTFEAVNSNKTITFYNNNTVGSNGSLCNMGITTEANSGTYTADSIFPDECSEIELNYTITNSFMEVSYMCIEPCIEKYEKVD